MGVQKYIYFGPYLEYTPKQIVKTEYTTWCTTCKKKRVVEICPTCQKTTIQKTKNVDCDIIEYLEIYNVLSQPHCGGEPMDENLLLPTTNKDRPIKYDLENDNFCGSIALPSVEEIQNDMSWFMDYCKKVIVGFKENDVQFQFKYGFVIHWS